MGYYGARFWLSHSRVPSCECSCLSRSSGGGWGPEMAFYGSQMALKGLAVDQRRFSGVKWEKNSFWSTVAVYQQVAKSTSKSRFFFSFQFRPLKNAARKRKILSTDGTVRGRPRRRLGLCQTKPLLNFRATKLVPRPFFFLKKGCTSMEASMEALEFSGLLQVKRNGTHKTASQNNLTEGGWGCQLPRIKIQAQKDKV